MPARSAQTQVGRFYARVFAQLGLEALDILYQLVHHQLGPKNLAFNGRQGVSFLTLCPALADTNT